MSSLAASEIEEKIKKQKIRQLTTFNLGEYKYGIDVMRVQEVTNALPVARIPLAPSYVRGLVNLRGQIATAVDLGTLFELPQPVLSETCMTVICKIDGTLLSLFVDNIGDVIEISDSCFEPLPDTIQGSLRKFTSGVYKTNDFILSIIDLDMLSHELNQNFLIQK